MVTLARNLLVSEESSARRVCVLGGGWGGGVAAAAAQALQKPHTYPNSTTPHSPPTHPSQHPLQYTFYIANFEACLFWYLARQGHFGPDTWVSAIGSTWFAQDPVAQQYI